MTPQPRFRHDHVGFTTLRRIKASAIMKTSVRGVAAALGLLTVGWPLAWAPGWAYPVAGAGAVAVLAGAFAAWRRGPALAVAAAVAACAFTRAGTFVLAAEGLFILCYLLAADAPAGLSRGAGPEPGPARGSATRCPACSRVSSPAARSWPPWPCTRRARPG